VGKKQYGMLAEFTGQQRCMMEAKCLCGFEFRTASIQKCAVGTLMISGQILIFILPCTKGTTVNPLVFESFIAYNFINMPILVLGF